MVVVNAHLLLWFYPAIVTGLLSFQHNQKEVFIYGLPFTVLWSSGLAVWIFFVLSGFVLSYKFLKTKNFEVLSSGAVRRYPRLMIPVFGSVLIAYVCSRYNLFLNQEMASVNLTPAVVQSFWTQTNGLLSALYQGALLVFVNKDIPFAEQYNPVLWTMYYEFIGSFIVFGTLATFRDIYARRFAYIILLAIFINTYFLGFILGMILCEIYNSRLRERFYKNNHLAVLVLLLGVFLGTLPTPTQDVTRYLFINYPIISVPITHTLRIFGASMIIYGLISFVWFQKVFEYKIFQFLGKISFSVYLLHTFVIAIFSKRMFQFMINNFSTTYFENFLIVSLLTILITVFVSWIYTILVDEKAISFSRAFSTWQRKLQIRIYKIIAK